MGELPWLSLCRITVNCGYEIAWCDLKEAEDRRKTYLLQHLKRLYRLLYILPLLREGMCGLPRIRPCCGLLTVTNLKMRGEGNKVDIL